MMTVNKNKKFFIYLILRDYLRQNCRGLIAPGVKGLSLVQYHSSVFHWYVHREKWRQQLDLNSQSRTVTKQTLWPLEHP